jgi:hypothetical protein
MGEAEVDAVLSGVHERFASWSRLPVWGRGRTTAQQLGAVSTMIVASTLMLAWMITPGQTDPDLA